MIFLILTKLIPLYITILMGFIAGRVLNVDKDGIARIVFFLIVPIVFGSGVSKVDLSPSLLALPVLAFAMSSLLCVLFYHLGGKFYSGGERNLLAMSAGNGNTGYFGVPLALALFDTHGFGIYMTLILGVSIFENTVGYYYGAIGQHTARECLIKISKLPLLYGFMIGLGINYFAVPVPQVMQDFFLSVRGSYTVLGMMIIGLSLSAMTRFEIDWKFISLSFAAKFLAFPLLAWSVVMCDIQWLHWFTNDMHKAILLFSIVPMAANVVVLATLLGVHPEKAATAVFLSTLVAIFYVPLMVGFLM